MTNEDFIRGYLGLYNEPDYNPNTVKLLGNILDTSKDGYDIFGCLKALLAKNKIVLFTFIDSFLIKNLKLLRLFSVSQMQSTELPFNFLIPTAAGLLHLTSLKTSSR